MTGPSAPSLPPLRGGRPTPRTTDLSWRWLVLIRAYAVLAGAAAAVLLIVAGLDGAPSAAVPQPSPNPPPYPPVSAVGDGR